MCDDEASLKNLGTSATAVTKALDDLMLHIKRGANRGRQVCRLTLKTIFTVSVLLLVTSYTLSLVYMFPLFWLLYFSPAG